MIAKSMTMMPLPTLAAVDAELLMRLMQSQVMQ